MTTPSRHWADLGIGSLFAVLFVAFTATIVHAVQTRAQLTTEARFCAGRGGVPFQDVLLRMCCVTVAPDGRVIECRCREPGAHP